MSEFFNGWQRKAGIVTLVLALAFLGGWIRSYSVREEIVVTLSGRLHACMSNWGELSWVAWSDHKIPKSFEWEVNSIWHVSHKTSQARSSGMLAKIGNFQWSVELWETTADKSGFWIIHYWSVTATLTLLSAYLILSKPRKPKSVPPQI